jgi:hypothetical protein
MIGLLGAVAPKVQAQTVGVVQSVPPQLDHRHQTGLSLMPGIGYRIIVPYQERKDCLDSSKDPSKRVCTNGVPFFIDLQLSFGVTTRLDLIADLRFGVVKDISSSRQFAVAPGVRVWLDPDINLKFYTTAQALWDGTDYPPGSVPSNDFGLRNSNGLMYDMIRNVGFYVQFGESIGFRRWFRIELDAGLGVQVRFP